MSAVIAPDVPRVQISGADDRALRSALDAAGLTVTNEEARRIADLLGRDPTIVEANIFNTMWSEHCSYKSSRSVLGRHLPTEASHVVIGPGEDAGVVRFCELDGKSYCVVVAHESHNHPSQVVPNEGAATGIGGIVRDVYCMGADVIGVLDPLRFGDPSGPNAERTREIVHGVVEGIWQYGNALGVPNLGGDVCFDARFDDNCLVNVVAIGLVEEEQVVRSRAPAEAARTPYVLVLVGKPTDPSGFGGATFASRILDEERALSDKYAVQVPDPFLKRMLTVATADVLALVRERGAAIGFKDLGAGGIACATSELGAAAGLGVRVDLSLVPVAESAMAPEVIACSETQERYCLVVPRDLAAQVTAIYNEAYELPELCHGASATVIGEVIAEPRFVLMHAGHTVCDASTEAITAGVSYDRPARARMRSPSATEIPGDLDLAASVLAVLGSPNISSREHVYRHYDSEVKGCTLARPGEADAGVVVPLPGSSVALAVSVDGSPFLGAVDPYTAGAAAVAEAVRNVVAVGAVPVALTDCLNFGSPEVPEVFHDFVEAVRGIGDAAREIGMKDSDEPIPIVSGNVSFYNQSATGSAIPPSPIVCCVGRIDDCSTALAAGLVAEESRVYLLGRRGERLGASEFARTVLGREGGEPPEVRFGEERARVAAVTDLAAAGLLRSCHDIGDGGLAVTLAEMILLGREGASIGLTIELPGGGAEFGLAEAARTLFSERGGYVAEVDPARAAAVEAILERRGVPYWVIGESTSGGDLAIGGLERGEIVIAREALERAWTGGATEAMI